VFVVNTHIELFSQKLNKTLVFNWVTSGVIDSSWKNLTDTCELTFAKKIFYKGTKLQDLLSAGDRVTVKTGYDDQVTEEFTGYLTRFNAKVPLTMYFEDTMSLLKKGSITKTFGTSAKLKDVIDEIVRYYNAEYNAQIQSASEDAALGSFNVKDLSGARILEKLKETYGLFAYFRGNKIYAGFAYQVKEANIKTVKYEFTRNIISDRLEYRTSKDIKIRVKAISFKKNNEKTIAYGGDEKGELHTLHLPIGLSQSELEIQAEKEAKRLRFDGYQGQLTSFHRPIVRHGDIAQIIDNEFPEREGRFIVDRVLTSFGVGGIRRQIEPGIKA
jgi:hypothetical protein